ncbi:hypothetical protein CFP56_036856 [Quercus suber]|uniref:Uncharacterized protein n=1 Tax=Quercus suber TaxID=58331 RepID=A0AAW0LPV6_QUESU
MEEFDGLLNFDWSGVRNPGFLQRISTIQSPSNDFSFFFFFFFFLTDFDTNNVVTNWCKCVSDDKNM